MHFFRTIRSSIWDPAFYRSRLTDGSGAFAYYFKLTLLLSAVAALVVTIGIGPEISRALNAFPGKAASYYPDDLEITLTNRHIETNKEEPYALPLPQELRDIETQARGATNLVVFDTKTPASLQAFATYDTWVAVFSDAIVVIDEGNSTRVIPMDEFTCGAEDSDCSYTLTDAKFAAFLAALAPLFSLVIPLIAVGMLLSFFIFHVFFLLALLLIALVLWLMVRVMPHGAAISYGLAYRLALIAVTLPLLVNTLSMFLALFGLGVPFTGGFLFTLIVTILVAVLNVRGGMRPSHETPSTPSV